MLGASLRWEIAAPHLVSVTEQAGVSGTSPGRVIHADGLLSDASRELKPPLHLLSMWKRIGIERR
jgi:hypothetical protein